MYQLSEFISYSCKMKTKYIRIRNSKFRHLQFCLCCTKKIAFYVAGQLVTNIVSFLHSFILNIYIAPPQANNSEALAFTNGRNEIVNESNSALSNSFTQTKS